jgi:DNA helicase-2/ATP-dependent DNA helicase PcrA
LLVPLVNVRGREAGLRAAELASEIEWAKARLVRPDGYERAITLAARTPPRPAAEVAEVYREYERQKRRRGLVDFDDLIWGCADVLERDADFAAAQRWRFRHLFVDEFQDASPAQFRLLRAWLGDRSDLCVVGDGDQAIYGFAGADPTFLVRFTAQFPPERFPDVGVVRLGSNYRSTPQVVAAAGAVLGASRHRAPVRAARPDGPFPTVTAFDTDDDEARGVARALRAAHGSDVPWSRLAVLYRVNAQSALFEESLSRAGVPFRVRGGGRFLERPEVKVALDALQESARKAPSRTFAEHLTDLTTPTGETSEERSVELSEERQEHIDAVVRLGHEYLDAEGGPGTAPEWQAGSVVTGLERGLVPISHAKSPEALDEEQRLLYVALSRAERVLELSWARQRTIGIRVANRSPSQWLARVERAIESVGGAQAADGGGDVRERIADARAHVSKEKHAKRQVADADAPLFAALVEWRRRLSRASGAPAYVVFHDTTLAAIASARPRTRVALLTVPGVGPVKAERYGDAVLALVGEHASAR